MRKLLSLSFIVSFLFLLSPQQVDASLVTITEKGELVVNVLSSEDSIDLGIPQKEYFEVKEIAESSGESEASVTIERVNDKISLTVSSPESGNKTLDVTNYDDDIVEIEERNRAKIVRLGVVGDKLSIEQRNIIALTDMPINVDPSKKELSVTTSSGRKLISVLPREAIEALMRTKIVNKMGLNERLNIIEEEEGDVSYVIKGQKVINLFNVYDYEIDITARVSVTTGEVVGIDEPEWLKAINFLFV